MANPVSGPPLALATAEEKFKELLGQHGYHYSAFGERNNQHAQLHLPNLVNHGVCDYKLAW
jgi:hypothetical protein